MIAFLRQFRDDFGPDRLKPDPLLTAAQVLLYILLGGVIVAIVASIVALLTTFAAGGADFLKPPRDPVWQPITRLLLGLVALGLISNSIVALLAMIRSVGLGEALSSDNAGRLEKIAGNVLGFQILGLIGKGLGAPIGGDINGFEISADLSPGGIAMVLLLFILARVFRQGATMRADLEGTV